jgi:hypothetical protein
VWHVIIRCFLPEALLNADRVTPTRREKDFLVSLVSPNGLGFHALIVENSTHAGQPIAYGVEQFWRYPNLKSFKPHKVMWSFAKYLFTAKCESVGPGSCSERSSEQLPQSPGFF